MRDDLGGLPTRGGGVTRHGAVVRGDALDELTEAGRQALVAQSVRTIGDGGAQTAFVLDRIDAALAGAGARIDQVAQTRSTSRRAAAPRRSAARTRRASASTRRRRRWARRRAR